MNFQKHNLLVVLVSIVLLWSRAGSIRFELDPGHTKCIAEDMKSNSMTVGKYKVVNFNEGLPLPDAHRIIVRVTSSLGTNYHYAENVNWGHFSFQTLEAGDYMTCFFAADFHPSNAMTIDFDWKSGVAAKDWSNVIKKGTILAMEIELKHMYDMVRFIHDEIYFLREREDEMQRLNLSTNLKMAWLSFLSFLVCLSVALLQIWHLKQFFQKKKLI